MAGYTGTVLTLSGKDLQAQAQLGKQLIITRMAVGDGLLAVNESMEKLTKLKNEKISMGIQDMQIVGNGETRIRAMLNNKNVSKGFYLRELGIFAKIGTSGQETLYSYVNAAEQADFLPALGLNVVEELFEVYIAVGNAANVQVVIDESTVNASKKEVQEAIAKLQSDIDKHQSNPYAHGVPVGFIGMWSGSTTVPTGWALCNGTQGTPDLRDRFVVASGSSYSIGSKGGNASNVLTVEQMPTHTHTATSSSGAAGKHSHSFTLRNSGTDSGPDETLRRERGYDQGFSTAEAGEHSHSISVSIDSAGGGQAIENRPPYYALAFIMKLAEVN